MGEILIFAFFAVIAGVSIFAGLVNAEYEGNIAAAAAKLARAARDDEEDWSEPDL